MPPTTFMLIAGEASGDLLAAELVTSLRAEWWRRYGRPDDNTQPLRKGFGPVFFGAGSQAMRAARVEVVEDMTHRAVIGFSAVLRGLADFAQLLKRLRQLALERQPDVIITVDYGGFNLRFQAGIRRWIRSRQGPFQNWRPKLVQFVSPQVWGSRPGRALRMERDLDLLISILPFERDWFAQRTPNLRVEFVGHPLIGRHGNQPSPAISKGKPPLVILLPGSRRGELRAHLPILTEAARRIRETTACRFKLVVPTEELAAIARPAVDANMIEVVTDGLEATLREATLALSKTGTVTLELALFGVPAVTLYQTSWINYQLGRRLVTVPWLSMPNLLAGAAVYPEFIQDAATPEALASAASELLQNEVRRTEVTQQLGRLVQTLGPPGAPERAANAVLDLFKDTANGLQSAGL